MPEDDPATTRRDVLKLLGSAAVGVAGATGTATAAGCSSAATSTSLSCDTWYSATVNSVTDGDTADITVDQDGQCYEVRFLGMDTPEKSGNTSYEKTEEWEFIEDAAHLETWGNNASDWAKTELEGKSVDIRLDCEAEKMDTYDRLLALVRYDETGDGSKNTVYNKHAIEQGYARTYAASLNETDEFVGAEATARANDTGVWAGADGSAPEVKDDAVSTTFHPYTSSIKLSDGSQLPDTRAPLWAESTATQDNTSGSTVDYTGDVPLVGVDEPTNVALFGGLLVDEYYESDTSALEHFVFTTNLIDHLTGSGRTGPVLVDGGHHTFGPNFALSAEDVAYYQRYLEGQGIELHPINTYGDSTGYSLSDARALIVTGGNDAWTSAEVSELSTFIANGGAVILMGSHNATATQRANLNALASDLGTDLRLNDDDVHDATNNAGSQDKLTTTNFNTTDFSLWGPYSGGSGGGGGDGSLGFDLFHPDGDYYNDEYIDITNSGSDAVDMSGYSVEDSSGNTYTFASGFSLDAGATVRLHSGDGTDSDTDVYWNNGWTWGNSGDTATLFDDSGTELDSRTYSGSVDVRIGTINEDGHGTLNDEWVEFENHGDMAPNMDGFRVEDEAGRQHYFGNDYTISAGGTGRLHTGSGTDDDHDGDVYWGNDTMIWNNSGDTVYLYDENGDLHDSKSY